MAPMQPKKPMAIDKEPTPMRMQEATLTVSEDSSEQTKKTQEEFNKHRTTATYMGTENYTPAKAALQEQFAVKFRS